MNFLWNIIPVGLRAYAGAIGVVLIVGGVGTFLGWVHYQGYTSGFAKAQAQCEEAQRQQEAANQKAIDEAAKKLADAEQQLQLKGIQLDDVLKGIDLAADKAPDAGLCGLSADSLRRLNAIQ